MRLFNVENAAQDLVDDRPVMDNQKYDDVPQFDDNFDAKPKSKPKFEGFS